MTKSEILSALMDQDLSTATWTKSKRSGAGGPGDCLEVARLEGGWVLRHSINTDQKIWLTDTEYEAYCGGIQDHQPGLVPEP
ncbi:hypothetical protein SRB5_14950 [Streptomyces sp. RB5]|uniref:DUF397 domain-containing protein n=1 Tax=Streptomyces smaragdinus TaxID=2585196 RepID=A0A7K0CD37_9ACTN|nr:DUF397 domain-containing protein [Streptomyces smaragdinus]MQY11379.1 hypothetical protein [Streptomyces smaragdinus]